MKSKTVTKKIRKKPTTKPPARTVRTNPSRNAKRVRSPVSPDPEDYTVITDPARTNHPVMELVHSSLNHAYRVNTNLPMCFIFDYISPARLFKRGTIYSRSRPFPQWTQEELAEATETDELDESGYAQLMPFDPKPYSQKYVFWCDVIQRDFLQWEEGELRKVRWGVKTAPVEKLVETNVPAAYLRLIHQLCSEIAQATGHSGHEALRRCSYAMEILDAFGAELSSVRSMTSDFRSKILTPILQRQLRGLPDHYTPIVSKTIASGHEKVTIGNATEFYLQVDPTDCQLIPSYRRNLIYIPEMRWHLGAVMGTIRLGDGPQYNEIRTHQDVLMKALKEEEIDDDESDTMPAFNAAEVLVIVQEQLEEYFQEELAASQELLTIALKERAAATQN